ncbi:hypothetical protein QFC21_003106 [Naganishia friedmannii]|uniref:Uncharacterized protein n=1 Tax=Naganishia friedmannii TaxID=89922 RepID=A0ACC2VR28_9TREE|nr:hypothetical protein QFC21_003106 [Naganishia friedmannii]
MHHADHLSSISHVMDRLLNPLKYVTSSPSDNHEDQPYDRHAIFALQKETLELFRDMIYRSLRHEWRNGWLEIVGMEMDGWEKEKVVDDEGHVPGSPRSGSGGGSARKSRNGRNGDRAGSEEPG